MEWKVIGCNESAFMPCAREGHCACTAGSDMYIFGGISLESGDPKEMRDLWKYETSTGKWTEIDCVGEIPMSRTAATMSSVDGKLYLFGGLNHMAGWLDDLFVFNIAEKKWFEEDEYSGRCPSARDKLSSASVGINVFFFGGFGMIPKGILDEEDDEDSEPDEIKALGASQKAAQFGWFDNLFMYDTIKKVWSEPWQMSLGKPSPRCATNLAAIGSTLVIFGGRDADGRTNDVHFFDTVAMKWLHGKQISGKAPECRSFHAAAVIDKDMYIFGGRGGQNQHFHDLHKFDTEKNTWTCLPSSNIEPRGCHSMVACGSSLIVFGGSSKFNETMQHCERFHGDLLMLNVNKS